MSLQYPGDVNPLSPFVPPLRCPWSRQDPCGDLQGRLSQGRSLPLGTQQLCFTQM
jgi:hypothetical protein